MRATKPPRLCRDKLRHEATKGNRETSKRQKIKTKRGLALSLAGGRPMPPVQNVNRRNVQERNDDPPVGVGKGDKDGALQKGGEGRVTNFVALSAGRVDEKGLEGVLQEQLFDLAANHAGHFSLSRSFQRSWSCRNHRGTSGRSPGTSFVATRGMDRATERRSDPRSESGAGSATKGQDKKLSIFDCRLSIGRVACAIVLVTALSARADEVISRAWTIQNVLEPTFTEAISRADTVQNVLEPIFTETISQAVTECNVGIFADEDGDTVHDCNDICPGGNDLVDVDDNDIPDACEPGSCCFMTGGFPGCFNSNKLECESPPYNGFYGGEGSSCTQNVAFIHEPSGEVFIHVVGPPATCPTGSPPPTCTPPATAGLTPPPKLDVWKTAGTLTHSFRPADGGTPIPAGFFGAGSDTYADGVALQGVSLNDPLYPGADTIIRRSDSPFDVCSPGPFPITADPVAIEIIALSRESDFRTIGGDLRRGQPRRMGRDRRPGRDGADGHADGDQGALQRGNVHLGAECTAAVHISAAQQRDVARFDPANLYDLQPNRTGPVGPRYQPDLRNGAGPLFVLPCRV